MPFFPRISASSVEAAETPSEAPVSFSTSAMRQALSSPFDRFEPPPEASFFDRMKFKTARFAFNKAQDVAWKAWDIAKLEGQDVVRRIPEATTDRFNPQHALTAVTDSEGRGRYVGQHIDRMQHMADMYFHPSRHLAENWDAIRHPMGRAVDVVGRLDSNRQQGRTVHASRVIEEEVKDRMAETLGGTLLVMGILNTKGNRAKTQAMMEHLFPTSRLYGRRMRKFGPRIVFTKPFSRMVAHRKLLAGMAAYKMATHVGSSIEDSAKLAETDKPLYESLKKSRREVVSASFYRSVIEHIDELKVRPVQPGDPDAPHLPIWSRWSNRF